MGHNRRFEMLIGETTCQQSTEAKMSLVGCVDATIQALFNNIAPTLYNPMQIVAV